MPSSTLIFSKPRGGACQYEETVDQGGTTLIFLISDTFLIANELLLPDINYSIIKYHSILLFPLCHTSI
jgi:hypothetical protein